MVVGTVVGAVTSKLNSSPVVGGVNASPLANFAGLILNPVTVCSGALGGCSGARNVFCSGALGGCSGGLESCCCCCS